MLSFPRKSSRKNSKNGKPVVQAVSKSKPGLAVDTSFSRHHGRIPEQVFPYEAKPQEMRFISLKDLYSLGEDDLPVPSQQQLNSFVYTPPTRQRAAPGLNVHTTTISANALGITQASKQPPTKSAQHTLPPSTSLVHKRIKGLRPAPLELGSEVSPSDRAIPIGIEVSSSSIPQSRTAPTHLRLSVEDYCDTHQSGRELPTPTIVITPAREDFEGPFTASPEEMFTRSNPRPTSSVYSRYTNVTNGQTPPVPPLPLFATQSNASLGPKNLDPSQTNYYEKDQPSYHPSSQHKSVLSLQTVFEEGNPAEAKPLTIQNPKRLTTRSQGWWNVITSPFSPPGDEEAEKQAILSDPAAMARSNPSGLLLDSREVDDDELRSAPGASEREAGNQGLRSIPKRSDTAPGALDRGNAERLNIYRQPSKGAARSYYAADADRSKSFTADRSLADEGWSPSQSVYRTSKPVIGLRKSEFYAIPATGEAAAYYDPNKRFPSLALVGSDERGIAWSPSDSVAHLPGEQDRSPGDTSELPRTSVAVNRFSLSTSSESSTSDGDLTPKGPPYPLNTDPFNDSHAAQFDDLGQGGPRGYGPDLTPNSGDASAFKDFSATHPAASFPETPDVRLSCTNPGPETERKSSEDVLSPLLETPLVEEARTATFMAPETHREVEVSSAKLRKAPPGYSAGLGNATMASRDADDIGYARSIDSMSEDSESDWETERRPGDQAANFGYLAQDRARSVNDPAQEFSEKPYTSRSNLNQSDVEGKETKAPWYRRFARILIAVAILLLLGLLALLLVLFVPRHQSEQPIEAAWLNLTGFPPLPTGVATVINPKAVQEVDGCTSQQGLWSCGLPATDETSTSSSHATPDFRFQILFRDNILPSNETAIQPSNITLSRRSVGHASGASDLARRGIFSSPLWALSPSAPSQQDQTFLGQTTDNNSVPYDGEQTPFYITLLNASALTGAGSSGLQKRDSPYPYPTPSSSPSNSSSNSNFNHHDQSNSNSSSDTSNAIPSIPHAATTNGGYPAPAELYPFAYAQPLRLYDRGLTSEHYGFYTYYDRTLYVSGAANVTGGNTSTTTVMTSNAPLDSSIAVCTWSQTRLLVQIWTQKSDVTSLNATANNGISAAGSTANDMAAPGSFPYSATVTLDRHGGNADEKGVYCHSLDGEHRVLQDVRTWVVENRSFGGSLVNPGPVPTNNGDMLSHSDGTNAGGIDGGTGGCLCAWQNW